MYPSSQGKEVGDKTLPYQYPDKQDQGRHLFNSSSQENIIEIDLINNFGLDIYDNPNHFPLGWVNKDVELRVTKHCNIKFSITTVYIDGVEVNIIPLIVSGVVFGSSYLYERDVIFIRKENQCFSINYGKYFIINTHKGKLRISLVSAN